MIITAMLILNQNRNVSGVHEAVLLIVFRSIRVVLCETHFCLLTSKDEKYVAFIFMRKPIFKSCTALLINLWIPRYRNFCSICFVEDSKLTSWLLPNICTMLSCCVFVMKLSTSYNAIKVLYMCTVSYSFLLVGFKWQTYVLCCNSSPTN